MEIINARTGELVNISEMTDEELVLELKEQEEIYNLAKAARDSVRFALISRMEAEGAKLKLTNAGKVRLRSTVRVRDRKLVEELFKICPEELKEKCFKHDLRPLKSGLNELAKLGDDWRHRVDSIYQETNSIVVEYAEPKEEEQTDSDVDMTADIPF